MNKIYKVVWSKTKNCYIVASEYAKGYCRAKRSATQMSARLGLKSAVALLMLGALTGYTGVVSAYTPVYGSMNRNSATGTSKDPELIINVVGNSSNFGDNGMAIGGKYEAFTGFKSQDAMTVAAGNYATTAIGLGSQAYGPSSVAIGGGHAGSAIDQYSDSAPKNQAVDGQAEGQIALGWAQTKGKYAMAFSNDTKAFGEGAIAMSGRAQATANWAMAIGEDAQATAQGATAIGKDTESVATNGVAIGRETKSLAEDAVALGSQARATGDDSIAIGTDARVEDPAHPGAPGTKLKDAYVPNSIAMGTSARTTKASAISIGAYASTTGEGAVAVGTGSIATENFANAFGDGAEATALSANAFGSLAQASAVNATAIGESSEALSKDATALGVNAKAKNSAAIAIGRSTAAAGDSSISIGDEAVTSGLAATAIGSGAIADHEDAIAMGHEAQATETSTIAVGGASIASALGAAAFGDSAWATGDGSLAAGTGANAEAKATVAIGGSAVAKNTITDADIVTRTKDDKGRNVFLDANGEQIGDAYDRQIAIGNEAQALASEAVAVGPVAQATKYKALAVGFSTSAIANSAMAVGDAAEATAKEASAIGATARAYGDQSVALGKDAYATDKGALAIGKSSKATSTITVALGDGAEATADHALAIGGGAHADGGNAIAIGGTALTPNSNAISIGTNAGTGANDAIAVGRSTSAKGEGAVALGVQAEAVGEHSVAVGSQAHAQADNSFVLGNNSSTSTDADNTVVFGNNINATQKDSVYLGNNSAYVSAGTTTKGRDPYSSESINGTTHNFAGGTPVGVVTVGNATDTRRIQGVSAGLISADSTDAINGSQLYATNQELAKGWGLTDQANTAVNKKLGQTIQIKGGYAAEDATDKNIKTVANTTDGSIDIQLAKKLTDLTSAEFKDAAGNTTTVDGNGVTIANGPSVTKDGVNAGNKQITNVQSGGTTETNAANIGDVNKAKTAVEAGTNIAKVEKSTGANGNDVYTINAKGTKVAAPAGSAFVSVAEGAPDTDNVTTYTVDLAQSTKNAINQVATNTTNIAGNTQKIEQNAGNIANNTTNINNNTNDITELKKGWNVTTSESVGTANGTSVANVQAEDTVTIDAGKNVVLTQDGKKITVATSDKVATIDDGLKFDGDTGTTLTKKLNETLKVAGGVTEQTQLSDGNIGVVADNDQLNIKLAKDLTGLNSVTTGDTKINTDGITITNGPSVTKDGVDAANEQITNVQSGGDTDSNAANIGDVKRIAIANGATVSNGDNITVTPHTTTGNPNDYEVALNKDITLGKTADGDKGVTIKGSDGTIAAGDKVTIDGATGNTTFGGVTINNGGTTALPTATINGLTNKTWDPANYVSGQAATEDQLKAVDDKVADNKQNITNNTSDITNLKKGWKLNTSESDGSVTGNESVAVKADDTVTIDAGKNIAITQTGQTVSIATASDLTADKVTVGEKGKDGVDGKIGVNGKDGSAVAINGEDGSIGLNGTNGANGLSIKGEQGPAGVKGADSETKTRLVISTAQGTEPIATLKDGLKFAGDDQTVIAKELNEQLDIVGGADTTKLSDNNIGVVEKDGKLNVKLAKDLTGLDSVTTGDTQITTDGLTINNGPSVTKSGIDAANNQIHNVASAIKDQTPADWKDKLDAAAGDPNTQNSAVNVTDLKNTLSSANQATDDAKKDLTDKGLQFAANEGAQNPVTNKLGSKVTVKGDGAGAETNYSGENVKTFITQDADGNTTIDVKLNKKLQADAVTVGGKDGKDGEIGVKGADGTTGVTINGKDGSIGLNGKDGQSATITVKDGKEGLDGTNGTNGLPGQNGQTRIVYDGHELATMNDGLLFTGNNTADKNKNHLNTLVTVEGEGSGTDKTSFKSASGNIFVEANGQDDSSSKLTIKLNKDLQDLNSATFTNTAGDKTTVSGDGTTITPVSGSTVSLTKEGLDNGNNQIKNVASGGDVDTNAANIGDVKKAVAAGKTILKDGVNTTVEGEGTNDKPYKVNINKDLTLGDTTKGDKGIVIEGSTGTIKAGDKVTIDGDKGSVTADSVTTGNTVMNDAGITIKADPSQAGTTDVTLTNQGLNNGGNTIKNVGSAIDPVGTATNQEFLNKLNDAASNPNTAKSAVNVNDLKQTADAVTTKGFGITAQTDETSTTTTIHRDLGQAVAIEGTATGEATAENIKTVKKSRTKDGKTEDYLEIQLAKELNNLNSASFVTNGGATHITGDKIYFTKGTSNTPVGPEITPNKIDMHDTKITDLAPGKDDKDAVNYSQLKDAAKKAATEVKPGNNVTVDLIPSTSTEPNKYIVNADNVKLVGDTGTAESVARNEAENKPGQAIKIAGDGKNITTEAKGTEVKVTLNKNIDLGDDGSLKAGDTTVDNNGVKVGDKTSLTKDGLNVDGTKVTKDGLETKDGIKVKDGDVDMNNNTVNNVKSAIDPDGTSTKDNFIDKLKDAAGNSSKAKSAVNVTDLHNAAGAINNRIDNEVNTLNETIKNEAAKAKTTVDSDDKSIIVDDSKSTVDGHTHYDLSVDWTKSKATFGLTADDKQTASKTVNNAISINGEDGIKTKVEGNAVKIGLDNNVNIGGKDGKPGTVGVKGDDGKDGITIKGENGGQIVFAGKDGQDGKPGKDGLSLATEQGPAGVNGQDGETKTRLVITTDKGDKEPIATLKDGMKFGGDTGTVIKKELNQQVNVKGGVTDVSKLADNNIGVVADGANDLNIKLAKDLTGLNSATFNNNGGTTKIDGNGITMGTGDSVVSLTTGGLNNGGHKITNVAAGTDSHDVATVGQLTKVVGDGTHIRVDNISDDPIGHPVYQVSSEGLASKDDLNNVKHQLDGDIADVGALGAALSALKPMQYDPLEPTQVMAGVGTYRGSTAVGLGLAHYKNESMMLHAGMSYGGGAGGHVMANAGITWKVGYKADESAVADRYRKGPISSAYALQDEVTALKVQNDSQSKEIAELKAMVQQLMNNK